MNVGEDFYTIFKEKKIHKIIQTIKVLTLWAIKFWRPVWHILNATKDL